jgi:hypothetical protein
MTTPEHFAMDALADEIEAAADGASDSHIPDRLRDAGWLLPSLGRMSPARRDALLASLHERGKVHPSVLDGLRTFIGVIDPT